MGESFVQIKLERDELMKRNNAKITDQLDGDRATSVDKSMVENKLTHQKKGFEAQFIEYVSRT